MNPGTSLQDHVRQDVLPCRLVSHKESILKQLAHLFLERPPPAQTAGSAQFGAREYVELSAEAAVSSCARLCLSAGFLPELSLEIATAEVRSTSSKMKFLSRHIIHNDQ